MAENLNYDAKGSKCYEDKTNNCQKYGRLYDWQTATKACSSGWHLPSREEWGKLFHYADGTTQAEPPHQSETSCKNLKSKSSWENNENGTDKGNFASAGTYASWWSSTEWDNASDADDVNYKSEYLSVRCVKD